MVRTRTEKINIAITIAFFFLHFLAQMQKKLQNFVFNLCLLKYINFKVNHFFFVVSPKTTKKTEKRNIYVYTYTKTYKFL